MLWLLILWQSNRKYLPVCVVDTNVRMSPSDSKSLTVISKSRLESAIYCSEISERAGLLILQTCWGLVSGIHCVSALMKYQTGSFTGTPGAIILTFA